ncbi:MAG TPA: T9SS type A sorting domain-containing protein [candidate division Zixibacteria bacterium]|nr:T9SS type A sorting domain-containing protein [candidate division Zixibacteria bacterium]
MLKGKLVLYVALMLLAGLTLAQSWSYTVEFEPIEGSTHNLTFGVSPGATDGYDAYLDVPYFTPPDGRGAFFPLDNPSYPKLSRDVRGVDVPPVHKYWVMRVEGYYGLDDRFVRWAIDDLPEAGIFAIAPKGIIEDIGDIDPEDWLDMAEVDEMAFGPITDVVVRFMPIEMIDEEPPYLTGFNPLPGAGGVPLDRPIVFDLKDDITGPDLESVEVLLWTDADPTPVDVTDLIVWTPIVGGQRANLAPPEGFWPELSVINYSVVACDRAEPANCMVEPVEVSFTTTEYIEDEDPPQFYNFHPEDAFTEAEVTDCIRVSIRDNESGVDSSTIVLKVDGVVIPRAQYTVSELGTGMNRYSVQYCPPGGLAYGTWYNVEVSASDLAPAANSGTAVWSFRTKLPGDLPEFTYQFKVHSINGADTATTNLRIGIHNDGTDYYDVGLDVPQHLIPGHPRAYFPLMDPANPHVTALSTDIKSADHSIKDWIVDVFTPGPELLVKWDNTALPLGGTEATFLFAVVDRGSVPASGDYTLMELYNSANFNADQQVFIRMLPGGDDTTPPQILNITHEGPGADVTSPLCFDIVDHGSGVDFESFTLTINGVMRDDFTATPISGGYHVCYMPGLGWSDLTTYTVDVHVSDNAPVPNHRHRVWTFTTGSIACGPEFDLGLTFTYSGGVEAITFGMDEDASANFDIGIDEILPPPSPGASGFHFVSSESAPHNRLARDIRNNCDLGSIWKVGVMTPIAVDVTWNPSAAIFSDHHVTLYYQVTSAVAPPPDRPYIDDSWSVLSDASEISYSSATQILWISVDYPEEVVVENFNISGTVNVFGEEDNSGVRVQVAGGSWVETGPTGEYGFVGLPLGCHQLTYTYGTWDPVIDTVCGTVSGETVVNDVTVYPPGQRVYGLITVDGAPQAGVTILVDAVEGSDVFNTYTSATGSYNFPLIPAGEYTMTLDYPGYPLWDTTFTVASEDVEINHNLVQLPVPISGIARLSGTPTEGIAISVDGTPSGVVTDADGEFAHEVLIGMHTICGSYPGYFDACTTINVPREGVTGINLNLLPSPVSLRVEVELEGAPDNSGASVTLVGVGTETTPSSGVVTFTDLSHGTYTVNVSAPYHKSESVTDIELTSSETVDVSLCFLAPVTGFSATGETVMRPTTDALAIELAWTEPDDACAEPDTYYVYRSTAPFTSTTSPLVSVIATVPAPATGYSDETIVDGTTYYYDVAVKYDAESYFSPLVGNEEAVSMTEADDHDVLIVDWDNGATPCNGGTIGVGEWWNDMLADPALGLALNVRMTDDGAANPLDGYNLNDYDLVIVALGINDADNTTLPTEALTKLNAYRAAPGKKLIVEGPDFGADYSGQPFFSNLNLNLVHDGSATWNVARIWGTPTLWGNPARPFIQVEYDSAGLADRLVDVLAPTSGITTAMGWDQDSVPRIFFYNGSSQAIVGAVYLGGITDPETPQLRAVSAYLWKLGFENTYIKQADNVRPEEMAIAGAYPNPFNPVTTVKFDVSDASPVNITVFDVTGRRVETLVDLDLTPGTYETTWDASSMPSGVYFVRMSTSGGVSTAKLMLMK